MKFPQTADQPTHQRNVCTVDPTGRSCPRGPLILVGGTDVSTPNTIVAADNSSEYLSDSNIQKSFNIKKENNTVHIIVMWGISFFEYLIQRGRSEGEARDESARLEDFLREGSLVISPTLPVTLPPPQEAPALWEKNRGPSETPVAFIKRHYESWLGKGLIRAHLRSLDPPLYSALKVWLNRHPEELDDLNLPKKRDVTDERLAVARHVGLVSGGRVEEAKELDRLASNIRYREKPIVRSR